MDPAAFTDDENWLGGFYELAVLLGSRPAGSQLGDDDPASLVWRELIDAWLAAMGERIYVAVPFEYALTRVRFPAPPPIQEVRAGHVRCISRPTFCH